MARDGGVSLTICIVRGLKNYEIDQPPSFGLVWRYVLL